MAVYGPFLTRAQAREQGLRHYYVGHECKQGHVAQQYVSGGCLECKRIREGYTGTRNIHGRCPEKAAATKARHYEARRIRRQTPEGKAHRRRVENARKAQLEPGHPLKIKDTLRSRVDQALRWSGTKKSAKTMDLIGCSIPELRAYLEAQWLPGMSWDNWARDGWHIDHIRPCSSFDLTDPEQQRQCFHFTNLQPLWWQDNLKKSTS